MQFTPIELIDLFLRLLVIGQLSVLTIYHLLRQVKVKSLLIALTCVCLSCYLLLTAPSSEQLFGPFRGLFLLLTEVAPYIFWCLVFTLFNRHASFSAVPSWLKAAIVIALLWFIYFFGFLHGRGVFHQINHALEFCLLLHIIVRTAKEFPDDLVNARRNARKIVIVYTCFYLSILVLLELADVSIRGSVVFSLANAVLILFSCVVFIALFFNGFFKEANVTISVNNKEEKITAEIPLVYKATHQKLVKVMAEGFYTEAELTIKVLANKVNTPEHQLREMINQHMGFRNFSEFLNSYRIVAACKQLEDLALIRKPILSIALELGYGSIATFNRAFKAKIGQTPKEYRTQFQK